jgi:hypothetical protein
MNISTMKRMMWILVLGVFPSAAIAQAMERSGGPEFPVQAQRFLLPASPPVRPAPQIQRPPAPPARTS